MSGLFRRWNRTGRISVIFAAVNSCQGNRPDMIILVILSLIVPGNLGQYTYDAGLETIDNLAKKADIRSSVAGKLDPNFWPARGKKRTIDVDGLFRFPLDFPEFPALHRRENLDAGTFANRGRKNDDEESGVFWAGRGRDLEHRSPENEAEETFWANRGRSLDEDDPFFYDATDEKKDDKSEGNRSSSDDKSDEIEARWRRHRLFVEEPGWVWLARREARPSFDVSFAGSPGPFVPQDKGKTDLFWVARGKKHEKQKRDISRFKFDPCRSFHPKRNTKSVARELSQLNPNRFWPARGKKTVDKRPSDLVAKHLADRADRGSFWPARGKRPAEENSSSEFKSFLK